MAIWLMLMCTPIHACVHVHSHVFLCMLCVALWATRMTEETADNRELHIKTTLRELIVYIVFLIILCIGKLHEK